MGYFPPNTQIDYKHFCQNKSTHTIASYATKIFYFLFLLQGLLPFVSVAQDRISGTVVSQSGENLPGASITVKGSAVTTISHEDGSFSLIAKKGDRLIVSSVGYTPVEVLVEIVTDIRLTLKPKPVNLDEIILTGYTYQRVKEIAGSVASVKPKDLVSIPAGQVEQMLQGRVAGLNVITSGEPGSPSKVRLHGIGNFGDVTPLYIIDGIQGDINSLNPEDIESLQVLKDAGSYSVYGVRGANGVIIVTTKKGRSGKPSITYDFYVGLQEPATKKPEMLSVKENADLIWLALKNAGQVDANGNPNDLVYGNGPTPVLPDYLFAGNNFGLFEGDPRVDPSLYNINPTSGPIYQIVKFNKAGTDWWHEVFKPAWSQKHDVSASGGNDKNHYLFSLGYLDQQGTMINTYLKRFTVRVNTDLLIKNVVQIGENLQLTHTDNPKYYKNLDNLGGSGDEVAGTINMDPAWPVYDIKGAPNAGNQSNAGPQGNPVGLRKLSVNNKNYNWQVFGNVFAQASFLKQFTVRTSLGGTLNNYYAYNFNYGSYAPPPIGGYNNFSEYSGYNKSLTWTNTLTYSGTFWKNNSIKVLAATESISNYNRELGGSRLNFFSNDPNYRFLSQGSPNGQNNYSFAGKSYLSSFFTKADYGYKDKYFLSLTLRNDGSSVFGKENRFGWFPAINAAWRMTEEKFLRDSKWITELKLRASWGKTGYYGNTDPFNQYTLYGGSPADAYYDIFGVSTGIIPQGFRTVRIGNPKTGWQEDAVTNLGFESVLWNGKLSVTFDWYDKNTKGLLFPVQLPDLLGDATSPNVNVGNIRNTGFDILLGSKGSFSKNWNWDFLVTISHYDNKITKLNTLPFFEDLRGQVRNQVGHPIGSYFGYKIIGFFKNDDDVAKSPVQDAAKTGRFKYQDTNGDGVISEDDRTFLGDPNPVLTLGINIGFGYKNFDFSTFLYGSFGNDVLNGQRIGQDIFANGNGTHSKIALYDSWTPQHMNAKAPIAENDYNPSNVGENNSYPIESGTYFRNRSLILGYTFRRDFLKKIGISRLRCYLQVVNLFTITSYYGVDPELYSNGASPTATVVSKSTFGVDFGNYPNNQRQFLFGLNLNF